MKSKKKAALLALLISVLLHFCLASIFGGGNGEGEGENGTTDDKNIKVRIIPKPAPTESKKIEEKPLESKSDIVKPKELPPEQKVVDHKCEDFYEGIGVQSDYTNSEGCRLGSVTPGYPAHRAGVRAGDFILTDLTIGDQCPGRGPIGTTITIKILRDNRVIVKTIVREKICISPPEETP